MLKNIIAEKQGLHIITITVFSGMLGCAARTPGFAGTEGTTELNPGEPSALSPASAGNNEVEATPFLDDFASGSIDTTRWTSFTTDGGGVEVVDGQLVITTPSSEVDPGYSGIYSNEEFAGLRYTFHFELAEHGGAQEGRNLFFGIGDDTNNRILIDIGVGAITLYGGVPDSRVALTSDTFDPEQMRHFRFAPRETGTVVEYSADNETWTELYNGTLPFVADTLYSLEAGAGNYDPADSVQVIFDNMGVQLR